MGWHVTLFEEVEKYKYMIVIRETQRDESILKTESQIRRIILKLIPS
jgi:hypothetical protein